MSASLHQEQTSCTKTSRRRWSVQDGPKGLLRRMRSQLAEDGCPESQRVLAKVLLDQYAENGEEETARQAVFWFTQASLQGDSEATDILQQCLEDNIGISQHNFHDVQACLQMPVGEKLARRAARLLFHSLNDGADFITSGQLRQHIAKVYRQQKQHEEWKLTDTDNECKASSSPNEEKDNILKCNALDDSKRQEIEEQTAMEDLKASEKVSEERLIATAVCYHQGQLPPLHFILFNSLKDKCRTFKVTVSKNGWFLLWWLWLVILHHYQTTLRFWVNLTHKISMGAGWPSSCLCIVGIVLVFGLISLVCLLPVQGLLMAILVYASLASLILLTFQLLMHRQNFNNLQLWSHVFRYHCPHLDVAAAEWQYEKREWKTYVAIVPVLVIFLSGLALSPSVKVNVLPVAVLMTVLTLFTLNHRVLYWPLVSFCMYALAHVPSLNQYIFDYFQAYLPNQFLGLTWLLEEHPVAAFGNLSVYVGVGPLLHIMWIMVLIVAVVRENNILEMLLPHLLCLSWCHIALVTMDDVTSWQNLALACAVLMLLALLPLLSVVLAYTGPALILGGILHQAGMGGLIVIAFVILSIALPFVIGKWWESMVKVIQQLLSLIFILFLLWPHLDIGTRIVPSTALTWDLYKNNCLPPAEKSLNNNMAVTMIRCHPLVGSYVKWQATVAMVTLANVDNKAEALTGWLPRTLIQPLRCLLGHKNDKCASDKLSEEEHRQCLLLQIAQGPGSCSLNAWNSYTFALDFSMESTNFWKFNGLSSDVRVFAEHRFRQFALSLVVKDVVEFTGILEEGLGSSQVKVRAISVQCVTCKKNPPPVLPLVYNHSAEAATVGRFLFRFFLGPTFSIGPTKNST